MRKILLTFGLAITLFSLSLSAGTGSRSEQIALAMDLYDHGLFYEAARQFSDIAKRDDDSEALGYAVLCRVTLRAGGYEKEMEDFLDGYPSMPVSYKIIYRYALNRFDDEAYAVALRYFNRLELDCIERSQYSEFSFKQAYCHFELLEYDAAAEGFRRTLELPRSSYHAPSWYALGYMAYQDKRFKEAFDDFSRAVTDVRFQANSTYYMMECKFMMGDYDYLIEASENAFETISEDRKPRLARMLSEIYLVRRNPEKAQEYYDQYLVKETPKTRKDYFYVGSLLYAIQDFEGAVEHFKGMDYRTDSLGQIANYQMADCYLQLKNKVAAMDAFKAASAVDYDEKIAEDAHFNYAKLAFDLNQDGEGFRSYMQKYSDTVRGEQVYSYMALSYLQDKQYDRAIESYDKIDEFDDAMKENYMKANYLRGAQLLTDGSYRLALSHFKWAATYAEKGTLFSQYANFYLADAYYRDGQYDRAGKIYKDLYNASALHGTPQQSLVEYGLAYCYYREKDYENADRWFARYSEKKDAPYRKNAVVRRGDCQFIRGNYTAALQQYRDAVALDADPDDIYPYYQAGLCCGLLSDKTGRIEALTPVLKASPEASYYGEATYELGLAYVDVKKDVQAREVFTKLVESGRDTTYVSKSLLSLGMLSRNAGDVDEALSYYQRIVEQMPLSGSAQDALAAIESIYQEKGEGAAYLAYLEKLGQGETKSEEDKERIVFSSAEQLFLGGNWERAVAAFEAFGEAYPSSRLISKSDFYRAESYRKLDEKEKARDCYSRVVESADTTFMEPAMGAFAQLSYQMQLYDDAYGAYRALLQFARFEENRELARKGMLYSAWMAQRYDSAIVAADVLAGQVVKNGGDEKLQEDITYIKAKSLLGTSRREEALPLFRQLAGKPKTARGAESTYILIKDAFDRADYTAVEDMAADFSDSGTTHVYYLAKSIILLCDAYMEKGDMRSAKDNLVWIRDSYRSSDPSDDVLSSVEERLAKIDAKL
ncbi:MAG: tetratricopeptide repeat protein [Bacteroidales bacterium]|nr:tetratricopeptide repeat protein [Bacteroidales bacterium]